jgi:hypothetical protein
LRLASRGPVGVRDALCAVYARNREDGLVKSGKIVVEMKLAIINPLTPYQSLLLEAGRRYRRQKGRTYNGVQAVVARIDAKVKVVDKVAGGAAGQAGIMLIKRHRGVGALKTAI